MQWLGCYYTDSSERDARQTRSGTDRIAAWLPAGTCDRHKEVGTEQKQMISIQQMDKKINAKQIRHHIDRRDIVLAGLYGVMLSDAVLIGGMLEKEGALRAPSAAEGLLFVLRLIVAAAATLFVWHRMDLWASSRELFERHIERNTPEKTKEQSEQNFRENSQKMYGKRQRRSKVLLWLFFYGVQMVSLMAVYPGFFVYDAAEELAMVETRTFTTHHPLLHVLLLGGSILAVHKVTGSYNLGILCYLLFQMAVMDAALVLIVQEVCEGKRQEPESLDPKKAGIFRKAILPVLTILWLTFCPVITMFTLCSSKDGLFAAALTSMVIFLRRLWKRPKEDDALTEQDHLRNVKEKRSAAWTLQEHREICGFTVTATLMMLLRNNGVYAYAAFLLVLLLFAGKKALVGKKRLTGRRGFLEKRRRNCQGALGRAGKRAALYLLPLVLYVLVSKGLILATGAANAESQEILTVPIMQLARVWNADPSSFTEEDKEFMVQLGKLQTSEMAAEDAAGTEEEGTGKEDEKAENKKEDTGEEMTGWDFYNPVLSDPVKIYFRSEVYRENRTAFWKLWLEKGFEHPVSYLNAWLMTSYGFWTPGAVVDCYKGNTVYTFTYGDSSYFGYETEQPGTRKSLLPVLDSWYRYLSLDAGAQKVPVLSWILSPGVIAWCWGWCLVTLLRRGKAAKVVPYLPILMVWLTVLLGPCTLPRYVVYLWIGIPVIVGDVVDHNVRV